QTDGGTVVITCLRPLPSVEVVVAEVAVRGTVVGREPERGLERAAGLLGAARLQQEKAQVVLGRGVPGIDGEGGRELTQRIVVTPLSSVDVAQIVVGVGGPGVQPQGL